MLCAVTAHRRRILPGSRWIAAHRVACVLQTQKGIGFHHAAAVPTRASTLQGTACIDTAGVSVSADRAAA
jgi:hypothetical protein